MNADILRQMVDKVNELTQRDLEHLEFIPMNDIDDLFHDESALEILQLKKQMQFDPWDDYFSFDSDFSLISFSTREMRTVLYEYVDEIIEAYKATGDDMFLEFIDIDD